MNDFGRGFSLGFMLGLMLMLVLSCSAQAQQQQPTQLQQAQAEIARLNTIIQDTKAERNQLILTIAEMNQNILNQNAGLEKTRLILQEGINNGGKIDWKTLINDVQWNLTLPDSTATKPDNKAKKDKKR